MKSDPAIKKAKARLKVLSENEQNEVEAFMREKAIGAWNLDRAMLERHTREKAIKEGMEKGREELLKSQVARWSKDGLTAVEIAKLADVTPSEIEALLSSLKDT